MYTLIVHSCAPLVALPGKLFFIWARIHKDFACSSETVWARFPY